MSQKTFEGRIVGKSVAKVDALSLALGKPLFTDDIPFKNTVHVKMLYSPHAHANILDIDTSEAEKLPGVLGVLTHKNASQVLHTTAGQGYPEPSVYDTRLFNKKVKYVGDRVAAVAAETVQIAESALELIKVKYAVLEPIFDWDKSYGNTIIIHDEGEAKYLIPVHYDSEKNHVAHMDAEVGDMDKGFEEADFIIDQTVRNHYAQHCPLEPHISIAYFDGHDRLVIRSATQVPFHARRIVAQVLGIPLSKVRVIKPRIGGGFGTKQEIITEIIAAAFAMELKRPVKFEYTRKEEFISARTRHPMTVQLKAGVKKDGTITAMDMKVTSNTGAYGTHGLTVMSNAGSKALPLYHCDNIKFVGDTVYTNLPVAGAYRGYGGTQAALALEIVIDELARTIDMDPAEFRLKNHIKTGESSPIFKALGEGGEGHEQTVDSVGLSECIKFGANAIGWWDREEYKKKHSTETKKRGFGLACLMQGSSIPFIDMAAAYAKMNDDGSFNLLLGATDIGTGSDTVLAQIFAEVLGLEMSDIIVLSSDTDLTPFDKGAYASSTTYLTGLAVQNLAEKIKAQLFEYASKMMNVPSSDLKLGAKEIKHSTTNQSISFSDIGTKALYTDNQQQIGAVASELSKKSPPPFCAHFAEVEVDTETGRVKVLRYIIAIDCGTPINPKLVIGQSEGALVNGIGYALSEQFIFNQKGKVLNPSFGNYKIMTTTDLPDIETIIVPTFEPSGPYGAKSIAEINISGPMPCLSNAIFDAIGVRITEPPYTPDRVLKAIQKHE
ncbi:MAG: molybdopterin-dependent oxidoreductase [Candidatus Heimdallarchaeota archaeon]|nr:MAG: molybdopterin-dependent oxidoreductase [Candidatus Heimdallarchaeota archaeon]